MATTNEETFSSLDPLGSEYGNINQPTLDSQGLSAFEGERIRDKQINFPTAPSFTPVTPGLNNLELPNHNIKKNIVGTAPNKPGVNKNTSHQDLVNGLKQGLRAQIQTNQDKNAYAKIYSYDAGPDANAFYKRYQAYGQETFDKIGFSPLRDNEALFNSRTTMWDDHARMMKHSFWPLFSQGFVAGPKSLIKMASGDFTSSDLEESKAYEEAAAIGQSNKGGIGGFTNNLLMNFAYSAGIMTEAIAEEVAGIVLAPETLGASFFLTSANNLRKAPMLFKGIKAFDKATDGLSAINKTLKSVDNFAGAKKFWEGTKALSSSSLNPLKNTFQALQEAQGTVKYADQVYNFTNLGKAYKTAGGFYKDVRNINMALSEARLEAGTVENKIYDNLYNEYYKKHGTSPDDAQQYEMIKQAKKGAVNTLYWNTALIYGSNTITFPNIVGPKGGLNNFMKNTVKEIQTVEGGKFGKLGSIVYDKAKKEFAFQANDFKTYVKNWAKQPIYKSLKSTLGYTKANFTEGAQESLQEIISGANERYYTDSFKSPVVQSHTYAKGISQYNSMTQGDYMMAEAKKQMSSQGFETFASGFFMGTLASPINKSFDLLSVGYNRMFKPEVYQQYKTEKEKIATETVNQLNNIDIKDFFDSRMFNYGVQDAVSSIKKTGTTKEAHDADHDGFMSQMDMLMRTGTLDVFKDKLKEMQQMTPEEIEENIPTIPKGEAEKYQARIDDTLTKIDRIEKKRDYYNQKFPNPVDIDNVDASNIMQYEDDVALHYAWNDAIKHAVYFNETFEDTMKRKKDIVSRYLSKTPLKGMSQIDSEVLFDNNKLDNEIMMLSDEVEALKKLDDPQSKKQLKEKSKKLEAYQILNEATYNFKTFFNRYDNTENLKAQLQKVKGEEPVTDEELEKALDEKYGEFSEENIGLYYSNYANGYKKYLKMISNDDDMLFDQDIQESFILLADHHKLDKESRKLMSYVNLLHDPNGFIQQVERTKEWMKDLYRRRESYYKEMVDRELDNVEDNTLMNALADVGIYMSSDDYINYKDNGIPPSEFFDNVNKMVYKRGTQKYNKIYNEYLEKKDSLKASKVKKKTGTSTLKDTFNKKLEEINKKEQEELNALAKSKTRADVKTFETNNINFTDVEFIKSQLEPEQYVELKYPEAPNLNKIFFLDKDGVLKYDDVNGVPITDSDLDFGQSGAYEATVFNYTEAVDPELKKEIQDRYQKQRDEILKEYNKDITYEGEEGEFTPVPDNVTGEQLKKDHNSFYEKEIKPLFNTYLDKLYPDINDKLGVFEEEENELLTEFIKTPDIQAIIKAYNVKNSPVEDKADYILEFKGVKTDTSKASIDDLKALITKIENEIESLKNNTTTNFSKNIIELETELTNLRGVIKGRAQKNYTPEQKAAIENVKRLQALNKKFVEAGVVLEQDDTVTGLKKGAIAYKINGKFHRRVSNVIDKLKKEGYNYTSEQDVRDAYAETIEVEGLTNDSVDKFIDELIKKNIAGSDGVFFEKLRSRLKSMVVEPIDVQIKNLQKQIADLNTKIADAKLKDETVKEQQYVTAKEKIAEEIIALEMSQPINNQSDIEIKKANIEKTRQDKANDKVKEIVNRGETKKEFKPITKEDRNNKVDFNSLFSNISKVLSGEIKSEKEEANKVLKKYLKEIHPDKFQDTDKKLIAEIFTTAMITVGKKGDIAKLNELYEQYKQINNKYDEELKVLEQTSTITKSSDIEAKKTEIEKRRQEKLANVGIKQKQAAFQKLREAKTSEEKLNAINLIERNVAEGSTLSKKEQEEIQKIKDTLASEGYEVPNILGKQFHQGMKVIVTSKIPDENLAEGEEIITKVLVPQVNKDDKMVQTAQIEVTVGTKKGGLTREQWLAEQKKKETRVDKINVKYDAELAALNTTEKSVTPGQNKTNHDDIVKMLDSNLKVKGVINQIEGSTGVSMSLDYWDKNKKVIFYNHDRTVTPEDYGKEVELKLIPVYQTKDGKIFNNAIEVWQGDRFLGLVAETDYVTPKEEKNLVDDVLELISENTYADSRTAGNYIDKAVKDLFSKGIQPKFVEGAITREAYDSLFGPDGYLTELKNQADNGDIFIASDNLVVWDSDIILPSGAKDRIAGEIDLLIVDKDGTTRIVDIKTGEQRTWNIFNSTQTKEGKPVYAKRESFTLQQAAYSRLYENMFGVTPTIHIFPIERESNKDTEQVLTAGKPSNPTLFNNIQYEIDPETGNFVLDAFGNLKFTILDKGVNSNKFIPLYIETVQDRINSVIPLKAVATATENVVETPETNEEEETPTKKKKSNFVNDNQNDPYTVGTMVYDADGNSYQITKRFKNGNVTIKNSKGTPSKMTMKELEENYKLENEVYNPTSPTGEYNPTPEEEENLQASEDNVDILLDDPDATDALINDANNISSSKAEDDLLDDLNCK